MRRALVTGGAGFIGTHLCHRLVAEGWKVTVLDNLSPQIHGRDPRLDLPNEIEFVGGDVCHSATVAEAIQGQEVVIHLAAETGTGQSMYELSKYDRTNIHGTSILMEEIARAKSKTVQKVVVASSRAVYGEGLHWCPIDSFVCPTARNAEDMAKGEFRCRCPRCGRFCEAVPTTETCPFTPTSFYGITKQTQEQTVLMIGKSLGISAYALRYQNVYGPGQSLSNPYTGILAVFTNLARTGKPIQIFEDGQESRDFVYVSDVVDATYKCIERPGTHVDRFNVGSGQSTSVQSVAETVAAYFESDSEIKITGAFRVGDIRHNRADLSYVESVLDYRPSVPFHLGVANFLDWASEKKASESDFDRSLEELKTRGLLVEFSLK